MSTKYVVHRSAFYSVKTLHVHGLHAHKHLPSCTQTATHACICNMEMNISLIPKKTPCLTPVRSFPTNVAIQNPGTLSILILNSLELLFIISFNCLAGLTWTLSTTASCSQPVPTTTMVMQSSQRSRWIQPGDHKVFRSFHICPAYLDVLR